MGVKARRHDRLDTALESVSSQKQQHLALTAEEYLQCHRLEKHPWPINTIAVRLGGARVESVQHLENAVVGY